MPRQQSVRFPDDIAHAINREAERVNRSFSYLVIEACRTIYTPPAAAEGVPKLGMTSARGRPRTIPAGEPEHNAGTPLPSIAPRRTP
jgi:predicted transcriptional regulator